MPMLLHPIDAIARKKGRNVLFLSFSRSAHPHVLSGYTPTRKQKAARKAALSWLREENIAHFECLPYWANGLIHCSYEGHIYIDVPPIDSDETYRRILDHFEFADGTTRDLDAALVICTLEYAMENAHHDSEEYMRELLGEDTLVLKHDH